MNYVDPSGHFVELAAVAISATAIAVLAVSLVLLVYDATHEQRLGNAVSGAVDRVSEFFNTTDKLHNHSVVDEQEIVTTPPSNEYTYYHVTTPEAAEAILASGIMMGSEWESGRVYAWTKKPSKYAINNSGAHLGTVISFKTSAVFVPDPGIVDPKILQYGPVMTQGPIIVKDVKIVGG